MCAQLAIEADPLAMSYATEETDYEAKCVTLKGAYSFLWHIKYYTRNKLCV